MFHVSWHGLTSHTTHSHQKHRMTCKRRQQKMNEKSTTFEYDFRGVIVKIAFYLFGNVYCKFQVRKRDRKRDLHVGNRLNTDVLMSIAIVIQRHSKIYRNGFLASLIQFSTFIHLIRTFEIEMCNYTTLLTHFG